MRSHNLRVAVLLYALMAGLAIALGFMRGDPNLLLHPRPLLALPLWQGLLLGVLLGAAVGLAVVWLSQRAVTTWRWRPALRLHTGFRQTFGVADYPLDDLEVLGLTLTSAIAEELLFRGWLTPLAGVILSSLAFGLVHYVPRYRGMWAWVPMAFVLGLALGGMFVLTGNLAAPIIAHGLINYNNLHFINVHDPDAKAPWQDLPA